MNVKRLVTAGTLFGVALGLALSSEVASAQNSNGQWRLQPTASGSQQAVERSPAPATSVTDQVLGEAVFRRPVAVTLVPAILMSDGSVFANFGFGFEPISRPCSNAVVGGQLKVVGSNGVVLSQPTYTQPVPSQQTASQQALGSSRRPLSMPAQSACFNRDAAGRVFVYRH